MHAKKIKYQNNEIFTCNFSILHRWMIDQFNLKEFMLFVNR